MNSLHFFPALVFYKNNVQVGLYKKTLCMERLEYVMFILQVIDKNTKEAEIINQYVKNTHAATHNTYTLEVQEVSHYRKNNKTNLISYFMVNAHFL